MLTAAEPAETLLELFTRYNQDWWPAHVIAYVLGLAIVVALLGRRAATTPSSSRSSPTPPPPRWRICPPARSTPTRPGRCCGRSRTT